MHVSLGANFLGEKVAKEPEYELEMAKLHIMTQHGLVVIVQITKFTTNYEEQVSLSILSTYMLNN